MKVLLYISYILTLTIMSVYISFAQHDDFPLPQKAWGFCNNKGCNELQPPPNWLKGLIFRFLWPKKHNIDETVTRLQKIIPRLESKGIDIKPVKQGIMNIIISDESSEQLLIIWSLTNDKNIKKKYGSKIFFMHTQIVKELRSIRQYISINLWSKNQKQQNYLRLE